MAEKLILAIVVAIVITAHLWLYKWLKFKMDEGTILKCLQEPRQCTFLSSEAIASSTHIAVGRVAAVCSQSKLITGNTEEKESWRLN